MKPNRTGVRRMPWVERHGGLIELTAGYLLTQGLAKDAYGLIVRAVWSGDENRGAVPVKNYAPRLNENRSLTRECHVEERPDVSLRPCNQVERDIGDGRRVEEDSARNRVSHRTSISAMKRDADWIAIEVEESRDAIFANAVCDDLKIAAVRHQLLIDNEPELIN
jgi:hypothetical protein